jgi:hypothetical protein
VEVGRHALQRGKNLLERLLLLRELLLRLLLFLVQRIQLLLGALQSRLTLQTLPAFGG